MTVDTTAAPENKKPNPSIVRSKNKESTFF
jgi:hypothetical protein